MPQLAAQAREFSNVGAAATIGRNGDVNAHGRLQISGFRPDDDVSG
jgi:hypothetical protein